MAKSECQLHNIWVDPIMAAYLMSLDGKSTFVVHFICILLVFILGFQDCCHAVNKRKFCISMPQYCHFTTLHKRMQSSGCQNQTIDTKGWTWLLNILCKSGNYKWIIAVGWKACSHLYFSKRLLTIWEAIYYWKHYFYSICGSSKTQWKKRMF